MIVKKDDEKNVKINEIYRQVSKEKFIRISFFCNKNGKKISDILENYYKSNLVKNEISIESLKNTYFTLLSGEVEEDIDKFIKFMLQCVIEQCSMNIKKIKKLNKIYKEDYDSFKEKIGGTTIYKVYPYIIKKIVFTTADIVSECNIHINSVNKVLNKLVNEGYLIKEKKNGTNRVTFCYKKMYDVFTM